MAFSVLLQSVYGMVGIGLASTDRCSHGVLGYSILSFVALLIWRFYRFTLSPLLRPDEPKEIPYWIPFVGHLFGFFNNSDQLLLRSRQHFHDTREPFTLTVLGMTTYILTKAEDVSQVYRNTETLSYAEFVQAMMQVLGNSKSAVKALFTPLPKDKEGFPNPHGKPMGILFRDMHIRQLFPGENLNFLESRFGAFFDMHLHLDIIGKSPYATIESIKDTKEKPQSVVVPLTQWCSDYFTQAGQDAYFGPKLAEIDPGLTDAFIIFDELSYQVIYQYPHFLAREMRSSRDRLLTAFKQYLNLPFEERTGDAWFVKASEVEMKALGLSSEDMAIAIMTIYWAINTNSRKASFWLLAHLLQKPALIDIVRAETAPAFRADGSVDFDYLHTSVPQLDAMWQEILRLSSFSASVRFITDDTLVGGKLLKKGNRLIMPYRQLHMNEAVFGKDVQNFSHERFLEKPRLAQGANFRPFGGGSTACPGAHIAKRAVLLFAATVIQRFDIELAEGLQTLEPDLTKPVPGLMSQKLGSELMVRLIPRKV